MTDTPPRWPPRQPKLRSSCDECGAAKLKCDRSQPACGRCRSLGVSCVYGVSRKMGKPPRKRPRAPDAPATAPARDQPPPRDDRGSHHPRRPSDLSFGGGGGDGGGGGGFEDEGLHAATADGYGSDAPSLGVGGDAQELLFGDVLDPLPDLPDLSLLGFEGEGALQSGPMFPLDSLDIAGFAAATAAAAAAAATTTTTAAAPLHLQPDPDFDYAATPPLPVPPRSSSDHDHQREAYELLGRLYFPHTHAAQGGANTPARPGPPAMHSSSSSSSSPSPPPLPLDHILRLNREAMDQLGSLLTCARARSPQQALLYASIISRILVWYQQAAGCADDGECNPATLALDALSQDTTMSGSSPGSMLGQVSGSSGTASTVASTLSSGAATSASSVMSQSTGPSVGPAKMVIGTFDVDDHRIQVALKIQLLTGEMGRAARLIDQFTSYISFGPALSDEYAFGSVNSLYQSLYSWLKGGHSRISNMLRSKLREMDS